MRAEWLSRSLMTMPMYLTLCTTQKQFSRELRHLKLARNAWPDFLATTHAHATTHFFVNEGKESAIVCIHPAPERDQLEVVGLIVHEAVHVWQAVADNIGEKHPSSEFEAYGVQGIAQSLLGEYRRQIYGEVQG